MTQINNSDTFDADDYSRRRPKWTIMVYIAGDNNLSANSIAIMQELEAAAAHPDVRVLACYDSNAPLSKGARYLEIKHRRYVRPSSGGHYPMNWGLHNDMVYPDGHMVTSPDFCNDDPASIEPVYEPTAKEGLSRFLKWALRHHRADRHMLILFGHGVLVAGNTFLGDTNPPSFLRLPDFVRILKTHFGAAGDTSPRPKPHLDILACDNCVMNAVEAAYEIRYQVDFMIGSQDLMLAVGWPFRKIIEVVQRNPNARTNTIARRILKACARRLLDYTLMERSTEQAVCDLRKLRDNRLKNAIKSLADALKDGLRTDRMGRVCYPEIRDAVRLARLEAQSYWDETFVDLYDFCELLLKRSGKYVARQTEWFSIFENRLLHSQPGTDAENTGEFVSSPDSITDWFLTHTTAGPIWDRIKTACIAVLDQFMTRQTDGTVRKDVVPYSYYVCPDLQYSHGLSIYFPWTLPNTPIIFEPGTGSGPYSAEDYQLKTAFDEYKEYGFPSCAGTDWVGFLVQFFKATLRNVRMVDSCYKDARQGTLIYTRQANAERVTPPANLQKSGPDTGEQDDAPRARIKNYPRRFYLSPEDCKHRCPPYEVPAGNEANCGQPAGDTDSITETYTNCVPYLGWRIRGIVAQVIGLPPEHLEDADEEVENQEAAAEE